MPYARATLSDLRGQVAADIDSSLGDVDPLLRFSSLKITGTVQAGMTNLQLGYVDYVSKMAVPFTAEDEYLVGWAALKNVQQKGAGTFAGQAAFSGDPNADGVIDAGTQLFRGDGVTYTTTAASQTGVDGTRIVSFKADAAGADGNCDVGSKLTLGSSVTGVQSTGAVTAVTTTGVDAETPDAFRSRMLQVYRSPPQGGAQSDYVTWAEQVTGVTRAWSVPNGWGPGTVVIYVMMDVVRADAGGLPQGTRGVSSKEPRGAAATGDLLTVADYIYPLQPATALVYLFPPEANTIDFSLRGLSSLSADDKAAVAAAISTVFATKGDLGGTVYIADLETAISAAAGTEAFGLASPTTDIASAANAVPVLGNITWLP